MGDGEEEGVGVVVRLYDVGAGEEWVKGADGVKEVGYEGGADIGTWEGDRMVGSESEPSSKVREGKFGNSEVGVFFERFCIGDGCCFGDEIVSFVLVKVDRVK